MNKFDTVIHNITEKLALKGDYKGGIYQRLVAGYYMVMPRLTKTDIPAWDELSKKFKRQKEFLSSKFEQEPVQGDPYSSSKDLISSIDNQRATTKKPNVKVYAVPPSGAEDDDDAAVGHPLWSNDENVDVRWVHDIIAHYYGKHKFSARGEYGAFNRHTKTLGAATLASKALFTEVVAQTSCYYVYGDFVEQKVTLMTQHFDQQNIGALNPSSPLNKYFELRDKELVKRDTFDSNQFMKEFPVLSKELKRQETTGKNKVPLTPIF